MMTTKEKYLDIWSRVCELIDEHKEELRDSDISFLETIEFKTLTLGAIMELPNDLKPCPFCGGPARLYEGLYHRACCLDNNCAGSMTQAFDTKEEALAAWNKRDDED